MPPRAFHPPLIASADPAEQARQAPVLARLARGGAYHRQEQECSRLAVVAEILAALAVPVALVAVLLTRSAQVEPLVGVLILCGAIVMASAALGVGLVAALEIWRDGSSGITRLLRAAALAGTVLIYPAGLAIKAMTLPVLAEVTTDLNDPPVFSTQPRTIAARGGIRPGEASRAERLAQVKAWPRLRPLTLDMEGEEAFSTLMEAVKGLKWTLTEETRPDDSRGRGRIEAVVYSRLMRLPQDVTIRLRAVPGGTRVDVRARSRFGRHDFGANAALIQRLLEELAAPVE